MLDERDMYYNGYSYGGYTPLNNMVPQQMMPISNNQAPSHNLMGMPQMNGNTYANSQFNDMNERINRLERQVKRLDQRLTRLETPYANNSNYNQEVDNSMYMM